MKGHKSFGFQLTKTIKGKSIYWNNLPFLPLFWRPLFHNHAPAHPSLRKLYYYYNGQRLLKVTKLLQICDQTLPWLLWLPLSLMLGAKKEWTASYINNTNYLKRKLKITDVIFFFFVPAISQKSLSKWSNLRSIKWCFKITSSKYISVYTAKSPAVTLFSQRLINLNSVIF